MNEVRRILIPTDFSGCADAAVSLGMDFARRRGATVELMHVCEAGLSLKDCLVKAHPLARTWLSAMGPDGHSGPITFEFDSMGVEARTLFADDATESILDRAASPDIDLLVMGTHGRHSVRRFLNDTPDGWSIGQTARMVWPETRCPVLAVGPQGSRHPVAVEEVVAPVDESRHAAKLVEQASVVARLYEVPLVVLHVLPRGADHHARVEARRRIGDLIRSHVPPGYPTETELTEGIPADAIVRDASHRRHPLLILASHGEKGRGVVQIGSVADAVTRSAPCPVLTLKPFGRSLTGRTVQGVSTRRSRPEPLPK